MKTMIMWMYGSIPVLAILGLFCPLAIGALITVFTVLACYNVYNFFNAE